MKKKIIVNGKSINVELKKEAYAYVVTVDGVVYKKTPNQLFAVQVFQSI